MSAIDAYNFVYAHASLKKNNPHAINVAVKYAYKNAHNRS